VSFDFLPDRHAVGIAAQTRDREKDDLLELTEKLVPGQGLSICS